MKIEIIPATDIIGGACVRLTQGDYGRRTTYYRDPLEAAQRFEEAGIRRLHMVDLDGAGLRSVIVGKALYEGRITLEELERCLPNA